MIPADQSAAAEVKVHVNQTVKQKQKVPEGSRVHTAELENAQQLVGKVEKKQHAVGHSR